MLVTSRWERIVNDLRDDPRFLGVGPTDDERKAVFQQFVEDEAVGNRKRTAV